MTVHQALYGDDNGAYSLLRSTLNHSEVAKRLCNVTDLSDRPTEGALQFPVIRGFCEENRFLFIKSFPDFRPGIRNGRVLSHLLFLPIDEFVQIRDLTLLIEHFIKEFDPYAHLSPIHLEAVDAISQAEEDVPDRVGCAINGLIAHKSFKNTVAWRGEDGYWEFVGRIWGNLPNQVKRTVRLGVGHDPKRVGVNTLNLLYVPETSWPNWVSSGFKLIDRDCSDRPEGQAANLIAGRISKAQGLARFVGKYELLLETIDDLTQLQKVVPEKPDGIQALTLGELINLAFLISKFNNRTRSATAAKREFLEQVALRMKGASAVEIAALPNAQWTGFEGHKEVLMESLRSWLKANLFNDRKENVSLVVKALNGKSDWLTETVTDFLKETIRNWEARFATIVWNWDLASPQLTVPLLKLLPNQAEEALVNSFPKGRASHLRGVLPAAREKGWMRLHAIVLCRYHELQESIRLQLEADPQPDYPEAFAWFAEQFGTKKFIETALAERDGRLMPICVKLIWDDVSLMKHVRVDSDGWQELWLSLVRDGMGVWSGIPSPQKVLFSIVNRILTGSPFNHELLCSISRSDQSDLFNHPERPRIWSALPEDCRDGFLESTVKTCLSKLAVGGVSLSDFEPELLSRIQSSKGTVRAILMGKETPVPEKIRILETWPGIEESDAILVLTNSRFSLIEATTLGDIVFRNRWSSAARTISTLSRSHPDLLPALQRTKRLLDLWTRWLLVGSGSIEDNELEEEYWATLSRKAVEFYPKGPEHNGLWERAGGDVADLLTGKSGRETWVKAIQEMRNGRKPKKGRLIEEMLKEFSGDADLQMIKHMK